MRKTCREWLRRNLGNASRKLEDSETLLVSIHGIYLKMSARNPYGVSPGA